MSFSAQVIADTVSSAGVRLTTLQLRYPRFIHAEFMTHRMFSRNASSSRAIPVKRLVEDVERDPALPVFWGKNRPGMQAREEHNEYVVDPFTGEGITREEAWGRARDAQVAWARAFDDAGYHKQIVNRRIENDGHINVVVTSTEWANFFKLRRHVDAQPEIKVLADKMWEAMAVPERTVRNVHLPYVSSEELDEFTFDTLAKLSAARCARVSYLTHEGKKPDVVKDLELAVQLLNAEHMSPFEHAARATENENSWCMNLKGWVSYRALLEFNIPMAE